MSEKRTIVVSCSGASTTGTTADDVARDLCVRDPENMDLLCLSAFVIRKPMSITKLENAGRIVVIEGCPSRCATEILKQGGFSADLVFEMASDYGIKKSMVPIADSNDLIRITDEIQTKIGGI